MEPRDIPSQCTSFLVAPDLALTNHHCLPITSRKVGASCLGQVWLHFPRLDQVPADSVSCLEVVSLSPSSDRIDQPDWALVRLARPLTRKILPLARDGVRDQDALVSWGCNPDWSLLVLREQLSTELRPIDCRASRRTRAFHDSGSVADYSDSLSRRIPLASCQAQKGNSGAPLLRQDRDGIWRIHAMLDRSAPTNGVRDWVRQQKVQLLDSTLGEFAYATNLACVPLPGTEKIPVSCQSDSNPAAIKSLRNALKTEIDSAIAKQVESLRSPTPLRGKILQKGAWSAFAKGLSRPESNPEALIVPLPTCWSPGVSDSLFHVPVWSMRFGYDRDLRWSFRMELDRPRLSIFKRCRPLERGNPVRDVCRFDGRFPGVGALLLATDTLSKCDERTAYGERDSVKSRDRF